MHLLARANYFTISENTVIYVELWPLYPTETPSNTYGQDLVRNADRATGFFSIRAVRTISF